MLKDILGQAREAMLFNRRRTAITTIGMAWGIATVVLLLAYGNGFSHAFEVIFAQWGTNTIGFFPGKTSQQAGDKPGVQVRLTQDDVDRVIAALPEITHISSTEYHDTAVENDLHTYTWTVVGSRPSYADIIKLTPDQGRFFKTRGQPVLRPWVDAGDGRNIALVLDGPPVLFRLLDDPFHPVLVVCQVQSGHAHRDFIVGIVQKGLGGLLREEDGEA